MITNGSLLTQDIANQLVYIGLDRVYVSLDGPDEHCFAQIRHGASYEEVTRNIRLLQDIKNQQKRSKPELGVEFVATKENFNRLPAGRFLKSFLSGWDLAPISLMQPLVNEQGIIDKFLTSLKTPSKKIELMSQEAQHAFGHGVPVYRPIQLAESGQQLFIQGKTGLHTNGHTHNVPWLHELMPRTDCGFIPKQRVSWA